MLARYFSWASPLRYARPYVPPQVATDPAVLRALHALYLVGGLSQVATLAGLGQSGKGLTADFNASHAGSVDAIHRMAGMVGGPDANSVQRLLASIFGGDPRVKWAQEVAYGLEGDSVRQLNESAAQRSGLDQFEHYLTSRFGHQTFKKLGGRALSDSVAGGGLRELLAARQHLFNQMIKPAKIIPARMTPVEVAEDGYQNFRDAAFPLQGGLRDHGLTRENWFKKLLDMAGSGEGVDYRPNEVLPEDYYAM